MLSAYFRLQLLHERFNSNAVCRRCATLTLRITSAFVAFSAGYMIPLILALGFVLLTAVGHTAGGWIILVVLG